MISLNYYLIVAGILFALGMAGIVINRRNLVALLMSIELMLLAVNTNFIAFSHYAQNIAGQIFVFFILAVAAAETAIGLAILMVIFKKQRSVDIADISNLRG